MERYILKQNAKDQIRGRWGITILTFLIGEGISGGVTSLINVSESEILGVISVLIGFILGALMEYGLVRFALNIAEKKTFEFTDIFEGFKEDLFLKIIALYFIIGVMTAVGFALFIVPGVIILLMFSQSFFILCEDNSKSIKECLKESMNMMDGHKCELFVLYLSFIGWILLVIVTCAIASLWITPYMKVTAANYYLELKNQQIKKIE